MKCNGKKWAIVAIIAAVVAALGAVAAVLLRMRAKKKKELEEPTFSVDYDEIEDALNEPVSDGEVAADAE